MRHTVSVSTRVGIRDVAAAADLSVTTVSHALNGKGRVPESTRAHVRAVAERLGYRPNSAARSLAGRKTGLLGLVVSQENELDFSVSDFAYFGQLMAGATAAAMEHGYALVLTPPDLELSLGTRLPVDGVIVVDPVFGDRAVATLSAAGVPVVTTGRVPETPWVGPWVDHDHYAATRSMLEHLARQGADQIAMLTCRPLIFYTVESERAYGDWCRDRGTAPMLAYVRGGLTESAAFTAARELLRRTDPPDGIYATYDRLGLGALLAAEADRIAVPDQLLVAACTNSPAARSAKPALTSLDVHPERVGRAAAQLLVDIVEDAADNREKRVIVPTRIVVRASSRRRGTGGNAPRSPKAPDRGQHRPSTLSSAGAHRRSGRT
jgi:DNA-binding LacI/PurR family transcriptional regulator